jgi:uncharacterized membrane protein (DUF2068 family)
MRTSGIGSWIASGRLDNLLPGDFLTDSKPHHRNKGIAVIAVFKLCKAVILIVIGLGALRLVHRDIQQAASSFLNHFRADPDNRLLHGIIAKLTTLSPAKLEWLGVGSFAYAALFLTEGVGLLLQKRWAEWLTVVSGASLIPFEIYELFHHAHWRRFMVLAINIAIVIYLVYQLKSQHSGEGSEAREKTPGVT